MPTVDLPLGSIDYRLFGPDSADAPVVVFVHGFLVNGTLWDPVAQQLAALGWRCVVPDWPLGAHRTPARADAELSPTSVAQGVLDLLDALDLERVILVGNDTGGAICQLALKGDHHRIAGLVLTNCDAFEKFPPTFFVPLFTAARARAAVWAVAQNTRLRAIRHSPLAFGPLISRPRSATLTRGWMQPALDDPAIRHDISRFARGLERTELLDAAEWLGAFDKPTRIVWGTDDSHFKVGLGERLLAVFPQAQLDRVEGATTFVSIDRPDAVTTAILGLSNNPAPIPPHQRGSR
jgi:pimeloyl-ACP methyl ester carboxylesterase